MAALPRPPPLLQARCGRSSPGPFADGGASVIDTIKYRYVSVPIRWSIDTAEYRYTGVSRDPDGPEARPVRAAPECGPPASVEGPPETSEEQTR
ncbi:hypothetical protein GCM10010421_06560 [Streptomyces glaucus]|uniref:Uncharacterized protein n=1 Tax=Streptomyces glaucus TaxID=284029 RepID=A0ABN3J821_9ACTN